MSETRRFDAQKCAQRLRVAALRDHVEAAPVLLHRSDVREELAARGGWPNAGDCMRLINSLLPDGAPDLSPEDVYIHLGEAANTQFIPDRFMFLAESTLRNCAKACNAGVAFMNSHRTGGLSHPAEQPFGKTFWGRYEKTADGEGRTLFGTYMLRGVAPTGESGPTTDDLHAMIEGGTAPDVSVGLYGGDALCDVCGESLEYDGVCGHVPGTHYGMSDNEKKSQKKRGVPDGKCSYSLHNSTMGEVSSVYDGAVPGAGFKKALALRAGMDGEQLGFARLAYHRLCRDYDFQPNRVGKTMDERFDLALAAVAGLLDDAEAVKALRAQDGRSLSACRWEQLAAIRDRANDLLAQRPAGRDDVDALRDDLLRLEAGLLAAGAI